MTVYDDYIDEVTTFKKKKEEENIVIDKDDILFIVISVFSPFGRDIRTKLAQEFKKDKLNFYTDGMYYPFRNNSINAYREHIENASNLMYLLNTVGFYTFDDADVTPCPYKLLIGGEKKSVMKARYQL